MSENPGRPVSDLKGVLSTLFAGGGVFAFGLLASRVVSIALLPVYTRLLVPADYGVMAILDVIQDLLRLSIGVGLFTSASRLHFESEDNDRRARIWWVAVLAVEGLTLLITLPMAFLSHRLSPLAFGVELSGGPYWFVLMLATLWFSLPEILLQTHLQVSKKVPLLVGLSIARLVCNAVLNVSLLYFFELGVSGVLWGNLLTAVIGCAAHLVIFLRLRGRPRVDWTLLPRMTHFGGPLVLVGLVSLAIHQIDRYILARFVSIDEIGIYSLAYQMGQGINSLVLVPFAQIWGVSVYEIAKLPNANRVFAEIFSAFVRGLTLVLLAASLCAKPLVAFLAPPEYRVAADLVPVVALAYLFFAFDDHLRVPALVQKRTTSLLPVYLATLALNIALNLLWVPQYGIFGAAWATVGTFVGFAALGLISYRKIDRIDYPLVDTALTIGGAVAVYAIFSLLSGTSGLVQSVAAVSLWLLLASILAVRPFRACRKAGLFQRAHLGLFTQEHTP